MLFLTAALLLYGCAVFSKRLEQAMKAFAQTAGNAMLSLTLQNALYQEIRDRAEEYVTVERDASGRVTAVRIHSNELTLLASELTVRLLAELRDYRNDTFGIPLGNLTSTALLSGRGPLIHVRPVSTGNVANELKSTLDSAGINQTLHRVFLHFSVTVNYLAPLESCMDTLSFDLLIAETLIVGDVPILYTG
ncbi:MAG: sporulation protein YunB [Oscillospiraceae bacterium]|nr:sporulation protein YunB [Oscillospiraceae bacterium]